MITVRRAQSSSYFLLLPRARSTGYFCALSFSLACAAAIGSRGEVLRGVELLPVPVLGELVDLRCKVLEGVSHADRIALPQGW